MIRLLVVAPAAVVSASLRFLLEAESYSVTTAASLAEAEAIPGRFACTVLDHRVLSGGDGPAALAFVNSHRPVVLLADDLSGALSAHSFRTLTKPLLGAALSAAVHDAIGT